MQDRWLRFKNEPDVLRRASYVIHSEGITVYSENAEKTVPINDNEFKNMRISVGKNFAGVTRLQDRKVTFFMTHPYMVKAFRAYAEAIIENL